MKAIKICSDCSGGGFISSCCQFVVYDNRCEMCGKFCKSDFCCEGIEEFEEGDEAFLFVCVYSDKKIRKFFPSIRKPGDTTTRRCKVTKVVNSGTVELRIPYVKELVTLSVDEISKER